MSKSADKDFNFCQIVRKNFVCSRTLRNLSVELVFYHFVNHILTNSTDLLTIKSNYRPVCDRLNVGLFQPREMWHMGGPSINYYKCSWYGFRLYLKAVAHGPIM